MKTYDYIIVLKRPNYIWVDLVSRLMLMFSIAVLVYSLSAGGVKNWYGIAFLALVLGEAAWWFISYRKAKNGGIAFYRLGLLLAAIGWILLKAPVWIIAPYIIAVLIEKQVKFPQEMAFDDDGLVINSFPKQSFSWKELNNAVLKDGILTIDFKSNKLIQKPIESLASVAIEQEFNEFCKERLTT